MIEKYLLIFYIFTKKNIFLSLMKKKTIKLLSIGHFSMNTSNKLIL